MMRREPELEIDPLSVPVVTKSFPKVQVAIV